MTAAPVLHMEDCYPEQHPGWTRMLYREALAMGASLCPDTQYMDGELLPDEQVWVEPTAESAGDIEVPVILGPGVYRDIPHEVYVRDPVVGGSLSSTGAKRLLPPSCPALYRWFRDHPQTKPEFDFGHAAHLLMLGAGPELARIDAPDWRTKAAQATRDTAHADGKVPVLEKDYQAVREMADALACDPLAADLLDPATGESEVTAVARDMGTGVMLRARVDFMRPTSRVVAVDYKTTTCAEPEALRRQMHSYGYHIQAAFYLHVLRTLGVADERSRFAFVCQEKTPPYLVTCYTPDEPAMLAGFARMLEAIEIYRDCSAADIWPSYTTDLLTLALPRWASHREDWTSS